MKTVRIGCGQGFWGDSLEAPVSLLEGERLDYLVLDYLAEVTMSILSKQRERDSALGYAEDFPALVERILPKLAAQKTKIIANAGGMNPLACAERVKAAIEKGGLSGKLRVAVVQGDDILPRLESLPDEPFLNIDTGAPISEILPRIQSANVYLGAEGIVQALDGGADIVVTGRVADPSLVLGPLVHEFRWPENDWNRRAAGIVAGHIIECGAQCSGGNASYDWQTIPDLTNIGYPVVEFGEDGNFVVTKQKGTGGRVDVRTVKEQLIYEIGDPANYITPDVVADFTTIHLQADGENRVRVTGVQGKPRPTALKVSISYSGGYLGVGTLLYCWPEAVEKAKAASELVLSRLRKIGKLPSRSRVELIGLNACHEGTVPKDSSSPDEVMLRISVFDLDKKVVERFSREMAPLVLNGPPGATAYSGGKQKVQEVFAYWPALISRKNTSFQVQVLP